MYAVDWSGWQPGDPTPDQIVQRIAECKDYRDRGEPVPEVRGTVRMLPLKGKELAMDLLVSGETVRETARRLGATMDEIRELADGLLLPKEVESYFCRECGHSVYTVPCVKCEISSRMLHSTR